MPHIQLRERDFQPQIREARHDFIERILRRCLADLEMRLEPDAVDFHVCGFEVLHDLDGAVRLVGVELETEVVVVQLRRRVGCRGGPEGDGDEICAEGAGEDAVAEGAVVGEGFVDDVPGVAGAFVVRYYVGNVCFNYGGEGFWGPCAR